MTNATTRDTNERVDARWVEDDESSEFARTFECRFADGSVDYLPPEYVEMDTVSPTQHPFAAAHDGQCVSCEDSFGSGELITRANGGWAHARCAGLHHGAPASPDGARPC